MDSLGIAGRVWLSGVSAVEWDGWIKPSPSPSPSPSPLQSVYRLDIVDDGGLILFSFIFFVHVFILDVI